MRQKQTLEILKSLREEVRHKDKAELKGNFGSCARGEADEHSDIDILVEFHKGATLLDLAGLGNFLEEKLQNKVDLVSKRAIRKQLSARIYSDIVY